MNVRTFLPALSLALLAFTPVLETANRLFIDDQELPSGRTDLEVFVKCDNDVKLYAVSVAIAFDPTLIQVKRVELAGVAADAEWEAGNDLNQIDNVAGTIIYGFLTEIRFDVVESSIAVGSDQVILKITFDTLPSERTTTGFDFRDDLGGLPVGSANVIVDDRGRSYRSGAVNNLLLDDGTLTLDPRRPVIQLVSNKQGMEGTVFEVVGMNFGEPGMSVEVCASPATFALQADGQTLNVTAPVCPTCPGDSLCCVDIEICNENGCDTEVAGFCYEPPPPPPVPEIRSISLNQGLAGADFFVTGANFDEPGVTVEVCGQAATHVVINASNLRVTAPDCARAGPAELKLCNVHGCVTEANGFLYEVPPAPAIAALTGNQGLADGVFTVQGENFLQPGLAVTVCDVPVSFTVIRDATLQVTAPSCATLGWSPIKLCNPHGCVSEPQGFFYQEPPAPPTITSLSENRGLPGVVFTVEGTNFSEPNLTAMVCGMAAAFELVDASTLRVTAPACGSEGWSLLELCNDDGCAREPQGFFYEESPMPPSISGLADNQGQAGQEMTVLGAGFTPGMTVTLCGVDAAYAVVDGGTLTVTAPACADEGWSLLEVCNDNGCAEEPQAFFYETPPPPLEPVIDGLEDNSGRPGDVFTVRGKNFAADELAVRVCGVVASFELVNDETLRITAPDCGRLGWATVQVCTVHGCITEEMGFLVGEDPNQIPFVRGNTNGDVLVDISDVIGILQDQFLGVRATTPCRDALDVNDDGMIDITDPISLLGYLFLGDARPPPPFDEPGLDPTPDNLPGCAL